jgi:hypothetical protein
VLTLVLIILLILLVVGGVGMRYPAWGAGTYGAPDLLWVLLIIILVVLLIRGGF